MKFFRNLFSPKTVTNVKGDVPLLTGKVEMYKSTIPRYPTFSKGLPIYSIEQLLESQGPLLKRIRSTMSLNTNEFNQYILPVIENYAGKVHLLPASEDNHHNGPGGLFRHGLEVAFFAAMRSEDVLLSLSGSPLERRNNGPKWQVAVFLGGLLHDAGKPATDYRVSNFNGKFIWDPNSTSLVEWANKYEIEHYFLTWKKGRHKRHEVMTPFRASRMIPDETLGFLHEDSLSIVNELIQSMAGIQVDKPVTKLILEADRDSTKRDLENNPLFTDEYPLPIPGYRYVFSAIRKLIKTNQWTVNKIGSFVWHTNVGTFIVWEAAVKDINKEIDKQGRLGIPRNADVLADILTERSYAHPSIVGDNSFRYWDILPDILAEKTRGMTKLSMLKIDAVDLIFEDIIPPVVLAKVMSDTRNKPKENTDEDWANKKDKVIFKKDSGEVKDRASSVLNIKPSYSESDKENSLPSVETFKPSNESIPRGKLTPETAEEKSSSDSLNNKASEDNELVPDSDMDSSDNVTPIDAYASQFNCDDDERDYGPLPDEGYNQQSDLFNNDQNEAVKLPSNKLNLLPSSSSDKNNAKTEKTDPKTTILINLSPKEKKSSPTKEELKTKPVLNLSPKKNNYNEDVNRNIENRQVNNHDSLNVLYAHLERLGDIGLMIKKLIEPILLSEKSLGENILLIKNVPVILYPNGHEQLGDVESIIDKLTDNKIIEIPPSFIYEGYKCTPFTKGLAEDIYNALVFTNLYNGDKPIRELLKIKMTKKPSLSLTGQKNKSSKNKEETESASSVGNTSNEMTPALALKKLMEMIVSGNGRWIVGGVEVKETRIGLEYQTSKLALQKINNEYSHIKASILQQIIVMGGKELSLSGNTILLKKDNSNE